MTILIETKRLILRQFIEEDAKNLSDICNQKYISKWMPDWVGTLEQRIDCIKWVESQYDKANKTTARVMLAVTLKETGELIGMVGIGNKQEVDNEIEKVFFIAQSFCNKGYISEASKSMSEWAFNKLGLEFLIAIVEVDNFPSQKVVEKCGFTKIETKMVLNSGENEERDYYYYRLYNKN